MLKSVGLQPGWHVLDAGSGSGSFLPLMSQLVGPTGSIQALDLAMENVALIDQRQAEGQYSSPVSVRVGNVTKLPYENSSFDAVWCAATIMYLTDNELEETLSEFRRVLKPNGSLAVKDVIDLTWQWQPVDPLLWARLTQVEVDESYSNRLQTLRNLQLPARLKRAGFKVLKANTIMIERWQPLREVERDYIAGLMRGVATGAQRMETISEADKALWAQLKDTSSADHILNHPDFYHSEGHLVIVAENQLIES